MLTSSKRVLIVDDEFLITMLLQDMLTELGHEVVGPASTLETAMELALNEPIDCAILDLHLGKGVRTSSVAAALTRRGIPFAVSTGYGTAKGNVEFDSAVILPKPFEAVDLENALNAMMRR
jgi:DNA-binding response OmpR family regulator